MTRRGALPAFLALYAAMYAAFGVASPFWPQYFETRGLTPEQLGLLLAVGTATRLISGPLASRTADLLGVVGGMLGLCLVFSGASALGLIGAYGFELLLIVHMAQSAA